jgi:predicted phosphoribosyltransferase
MERKTAPKFRILSNNGEPFLDRVEAGKLLAVALREYRGQNAVVVGIPRGGIIVAREIALALDADLDIIVAHKLRTPGQGELAMGSISERGDLFLNREVLKDAGVTNSEIEQEKVIQKAEIQRRTSMFRTIKPKIPLNGRIVIVTDDGVATGATTQAAIKAVLAEKPKKLILAVPVGSEETLRVLARDVDELVCLKSPNYLTAVGQVYRNFAAVTDEGVLEILKNYRAKEETK